MREAEAAEGPAYVTTGIRSLDRVLRGGLLTSGVYMIQGAPGAGKTTFGNQLAYHHVKGGGQALYVTLLSESHARMLSNLRSMSFFDPSVVPVQLAYFSAFRQLEESGLRGLLDLVRKEMKARTVSLLVLDGLMATRESAASRRETMKFVHELQILAALHACTMLFLTSDESTTNPEHTMVDGMIDLQMDGTERLPRRTLCVRKFRGNDSMPGRHTFTITGAGITVYPRLEALCAGAPWDDVAPKGHASTGIARLDRLLGGGGLPVGTTTVVLGAAGTGKTTLGVTFLAQAPPEERGALVSFYESPERMCAKAQSLGLDLRSRIDAGAVTLHWYPGGDTHADIIANRLLETIQSAGVKRVFFDGINVLQNTLSRDSRLPFATAFANLLRSAQVTAMLAFEPAGTVGSEPPTATSDLSPFLDNIISLRVLEVRSQPYRIMSVRKVADSNFDPSAREFRITSQGIELEDTFRSAEAVLTAHARPGEPGIVGVAEATGDVGVTKDEDGPRRR